MTHASHQRPVPRLPSFSRQGVAAGRVALSGFLVASTIDRADRISQLLPEYLTSCRAAPGCLRAEIWRSRSDPMRFAVFLRFRSRQDYERHQQGVMNSAWTRETASLADELRLHPE